MKDVRSVSLVDRRGYLTVVLELEGDIPGLVVRKPEGLRDWYNIVQKQVSSSNISGYITSPCDPSGEGCQGPGDAEHRAVLDQEELRPGGGHRGHRVAGEQVRDDVRGHEVSSHL